MDTKWRKFSRSRGFKGLLALVVLGAAAAIGAITGYIPSSGYMQDGYMLDVLKYESYSSSSVYGKKIADAVDTVLECQWDYQNISQFGDFYISIDSLGSVNSNYVESFVLYKIDRNGISAVKGELPNYVRSINYYSTLKSDTTIYIGFSESDYFESKSVWNIARHNMLVVLFSDLGLLIIGAAAVAALCRVSGEKPDGTKVWTPFFGLFYELSAAALVALIIFAGSAVRYSYYSAIKWERDFTYSVDKILFMAWCGLAAMAIVAGVLYFVLSIVLRMKNNRFEKGSLIYQLLRLFWKGLNAVCRFFKGLFTGELFSEDRASRRLILIDSVFLVSSVILMIFCAAFWADRNVVGICLFSIMWLAALALFIYGRYLLISDEAKMEQQIREMSRGNYSYHPELSKNSAYTISSGILSQLSEKYKQGIEESVRAERMKIELVTNVSHDLKTPLTSIISYVDLLSKEELSPQAEEYVGILQKKSERLKNIVADVFELAKTTSGEISVEHERLDLNRLSNQTLAEMEDKITQAGFIIKTNICEPPVEIISDGKRMYRVIQNLMDNALKYSLAGTRIYYTLEKTESGQAIITIKNISGYEMDFTKEEILERFTRGDKSRTTEGSGLGLSIVQGFTIACGGEFDIDIDGDMFKVKIIFPLAQPVEEAAREESQPQMVTADE